MRVKETNFGFLDPIEKEGDLEISEVVFLTHDNIKVEDRSLEEVVVPLTSKWIQKQVSGGSLLPLGLKKAHPEVL